ncbi:MAG: endopeptidase La [Calditrichia bacterium]
MKKKKKISPAKGGIDVMDFSGKLPLLPTHDMVLFPSAIAPLMIGRSKSLEAVEAAEEIQGYMVIAAQKSPEKEEIQARDIYRVGTVAKILQIIRLPNSHLKIVVEGVRRAHLRRFLPNRRYFHTEVELFPEDEDFSPAMQEELKQLGRLFKSFIQEHPELPDEIISQAEKLENSPQILDYIAMHVDSDIHQKQQVLAAEKMENRLIIIRDLVNAAVGFQHMRKELDSQVRDNMMRNQREYYLQEQLRVIKKELGEEEPTSSEIHKLEEEILAAEMPQHAMDKAVEELEKLKRTPPFSPEYSVTRNYLEWMIQLPWNTVTPDRLDLQEARQILDEDHFGLDKPKERILEHLAVLQRVQKIRGPILCLVGPPGVGKTSLGQSIARALGRKIVRVSLGGVRDEAEIRGHRRTYIGSMPGKIIQSLKKAASKNPVFLLDEVDKMSMDFRGDPAAALLEVLDPEQNHTFNDHYLDVDFDLSDIFFITTANMREEIPLPLQDRMEIIELPGYPEYEKVQIARRHLIPKQMKEHGLEPGEFVITEKALERIIREYTREAGVRNLERFIAQLSRKVTRRLLEKKHSGNHRISPASLEKYLGKPPFFARRNHLENAVGMATGLAWTPYGGDILKIEVNTYRGSGKIKLTGKLGDVMKESAHTALSYIRSISDELQIKAEFFKKNDIHIHIPEGAVPKDGPSAGITLTTAMISAFTGNAVNGKVAMTGEITLRGNILGIGGVNEKMLAARRNNIPLVLVPDENRKDIDDLPKEVKTGLSIITVGNFRQAVDHIFIRPEFILKAE